MDRFEVRLSQTQFGEKLIYIPVWIDLKEPELRVFYQTFLIYIPVWIDLKNFLKPLDKSLNEIYIPVWIDLKQ